jgi:DNA-binding NtrC family response regulator
LSTKLLVIDTEEIILKSVRKALEGEYSSYEIITCNTALDGLKLIRSDKFALVLIDLVLPGMDTLEVLRRIKSIDPDVPVVIMSGFTPDGIRTGKNKNSNDESLKNIAGFLLKPFTTEELKSLINRILSE